MREMIERFTLRSQMYSSTQVFQPDATEEELRQEAPRQLHPNIAIRQRMMDAFSRLYQQNIISSYRLNKENGKLKSVSIAKAETIWSGPALINDYYFKEVRDIDGLVIDDIFFMARASHQSGGGRFEDCGFIAKALLNDPRLEVEAYDNGMSRGVIVITDEIRQQREARKAAEEKKNQIRKRIEILKKAREIRERDKNEVVLMEVLAKAGELVHPGRWDIEKSVDPTTKKTKLLYLTIYFPEIQITNSKKLKHIIHDLYVMIGVGFDGKPLATLYGRRGSLSFAEYKSNYPQSHLTTESMRTIGSFCLGDANLVTLLSDMRLFNYFKEPVKWVRRLEAILFQIEAFMSWESLEGTPYNYIKNISVPGEAQVDPEQERINIVRRLSLTDPPPMIFVKGRGFQLSSNTEQFEEWLVKYSTYKQYKDNQGNFYSDSNRAMPAEDFEVPNSVPIKFRGEEIKRIVRVKKHEAQERKEYCHRQVRDEFVAWANRELERGFAERSLRSIFRGILTTKVKNQASSYSLEGRGKAQAKSEFKGLLKNFKAVSNVYSPGMVGNNVVQDRG